MLKGRARLFRGAETASGLRGPPMPMSLPCGEAGMTRARGTGRAETWALGVLEDLGRSLS